MNTNGKYLISLGAKVTHLPLMDTQEILLSKKDFSLVTQADYLVFTSQNAVRHFFNQIEQCPSKIIAIGNQTAKALSAYQHPATIIAEKPFTSESLLNIWRPKQQEIAIITGEKGRKWLFEQLQIENKVNVICCYYRFNPSDTYQKDIESIDIAVINSRETLQNLLEIIPKTALEMLKYRTVIASLSQKLSDQLIEMDFKKVITAPIADENQLIETICGYWKDYGVKNERKRTEQYK